MRNLKKFLALVLAMMMVFSMMITVNAATTSSDTRYFTAYNVMERYGLVKGTGGTKDNYKEPFTRAEMAAIAYRIATGDVNDQYVKQNEIYAMQFEDADDAPWAKGYIGYCANMGIVVGDGKGHFNPNQNVTGYQVAVLMLRLLGYTYKNEFTGKNWEKEAGDYALKTGISRNLASGIDLKLEATREIAIQMSYDAAFNTGRRVFNTNTNDYDIYATWYLILQDNPVRTDDEWGVPSTAYRATFTRPEWTPSVPVTVQDDPLYQFWTPMTECNVCDAVKAATGVDLDGATLPTYTNGKGNAGVQTIIDTDTINTIGGYGRWTRIYRDRIVYVDTVLAMVDTVVDATADVAGHPITAGATYLRVYGSSNMEGIPVAHSYVTNVTYGATAETANLYVVANGGYKEGDMVTVNILTGADDPGVAVTDYNKVDFDVAVTAALYNAQKAKAATPVSVTISALDYDGARNIIGFTANNGQRYKYSVSYGWNQLSDGTNGGADNVVNRGSSVMILDNTAIGKTYSIYTDGHNNVLGIIPAAADAGVGVVTGYKLVDLETSTSTTDIDYAIDFTIMTPSGQSVTKRAIDPNGGTPVPYDGRLAAITAATAAVRRLVTYTAVNNTYYTVNVATQTGTPAGVDWGTPSSIVVEAGDATALTLASATAHGGTPAANSAAWLSDSTVIFVENYRMDNSQSATYGSWLTNGFAVYPGGFKTIKDLSFDGKNVYLNGTTTQLAGTSGATNMSYDAIDLDGDGWAEYAMILYATSQKTNTVEKVEKYAFVQSDLDQYQTFVDYYLYRTLLDGRTGSLKIDSTVFDTVTQQNGLYIYSEPENGIYTQVTGPVNQLNPSWTIPANTKGIIDNSAVVTGGFNGDATAVHDRFLTVADGCRIFIANKVTGTAVESKASLSTILRLYGSSGAGSDIYFQLDQYGWINLIYVVDNMNGTVGGGGVGGGGGTNVTAANVTYFTLSNVTDMYEVSNATVGVTPTTPGDLGVRSYSWSVYSVARNMWVPVDIANGECFTSGNSYRVTVTCAPGFNKTLKLKTDTFTTAQVNGVTATSVTATSDTTVVIQFTMP